MNAVFEPNSLLESRGDSSELDKDSAKLNLTDTPVIKTESEKFCLCSTQDSKM